VVRGTWYVVRKNDDTFDETCPNLGLVDSYRSLEVWQRAHQAALATLRACDASYHPRSRSLFDQLKRSAISVEANIVEGYALGTKGYSARHMRIALGSAAEAECMARLGAEAGYLQAGTVSELERLFGGTMRALRGILKSDRVLANPRDARAS
jgi:four helix bundle protein